jgi:hypothetical protein
LNSEHADRVFCIAHERLADLRRARLPLEDFRSSVSTLIVVASTFRGGSTLLTELLRRSSNLLHFQSEMNPMLRLAGWTYPENGAGSDYMTDLIGNIDFLELELSSDVGNPVDEWDEVDWSRFAQDTLWRWIMQWPELGVTLFEVEEMVQGAVAAVRRDKTRSLEHRLQAINMDLLRCLVAKFPGVNPYYTSISASKLQDVFPDIRKPIGPHAATIVEMAPMVTPRPWRGATSHDVEGLPVVNKTPVNVYKLSALQKFFPRASLRIIHLTRNPGAAINSMREAWLSPWFFNAAVDVTLKIKGYTSSEMPWSAHWWCLDFPPGWQSLAGKTLEEVCAAQWCATHTAIESFLAENRDVKVFRIKYEDLIGTPSEGSRTVSALADWLKIDSSDLIKPWRDGITPMYSITRPKQGKWLANHELLMPIVKSEQVQAVAADLGYSRDTSSWR